MRPNVLSPSRVDALGRETIDRLDLLWVAVHLARRLLVDDVQFFLTTRQPGLDYRRPSSLIAEGSGEAVLEWLTSAADASSVEGAPAPAGVASAQPRPLGWTQRTAVTTAQPRLGGFKGGDPAPGRRERVAAIADSAAVGDGLDLELLCGSADDAHLDQVGDGGAGLSEEEERKLYEYSASDEAIPDALGSDEKALGDAIVAKHERALERVVSDKDSLLRGIVASTNAEAEAPARTALSDRDVAGRRERERE